MQSFRAGVRQKLDTLPHDKIVRTEFLKSFIRSAVFIKGVLSEAEEDRGGYWARPMLRENNETEAWPDDMLVDVQEKRRRLWRETVAPAGLNMELVKIANGLPIAYDQRAHAAAFCFANGPANWAGKASD